VFLVRQGSVSGGAGEECEDPPTHARIALEWGTGQVIRRNVGDRRTSVLECLTLAGIPVAVDLMGLSWVPNADPKDWQWSSDKTGFVFVGGAESDESMLGSVESTAGRIGETADFVKHTLHAQELLRQCFRNYGYKISVKAVSKKAITVGKVANRIAIPITAWTAIKSYRGCRGN